MAYALTKAPSVSDRLGSLPEVLANDEKPLLEVVEFLWISQGPGCPNLFIASYYRAGLPCKVSYHENCRAILDGLLIGGRSGFL
jgi:hypothetical protein